MTVDAGDNAAALLARACEMGMNLRNAGAGRIGISLDETSTIKTVLDVWSVFCADRDRMGHMALKLEQAASTVPEALVRQSASCGRRCLAPAGPRRICCATCAACPTRIWRWTGP